MTCGILARISYFNIISSRRLQNDAKRISRVNELEQRELSGVQSSWKELADLSYGEKTIEHRNKLRKALSTFLSTSVLKKVEFNRHVVDLEAAVEIGSFAVGTSTSSSDLDVLIVPFYDRHEEKYDKFMANWKDEKYRTKFLYSISNKIFKMGIVKKKPDVYWHARVPIVHGETLRGVPFDIQVGGTDMIYSNNFVRLAFQLDPRQILVYHWLREQLVKYNIFGGRRGCFTPFHLYMLVIHFAQATEKIPKLMDEYPVHLSKEKCHWTILVKNFRNGKKDLPPLYTTEDVDKWAPVLIDQLIEYYGQIDFTMSEIDVGKGIRMDRPTDNLLLIEPFSDPDVGVCRVRNGATLMNVFFAKLVKNRFG